ncbi:DNA-binding response regulator [Actinomadura spongiicola]|uniref:DNA-binding response regulator n=1 Tax=Actinomadura spongiicola TaxID=2303421 RepID=A0A372G6L7_9ACTN|nr:response regulator transcription factor [Actinomadura spongiicola]RFS81040.1 DNA-binding response regulator [Actinomadura spongiicola]
MIRVLVADDQQLVRMGLRMLCESAGDVRVVGEAADGVEAVALTGRLGPDVVLMDLRMPGLDGAAATERIVAAHPSTRVLALTTFGDDDHLYPALAAGACGFLLKSAPPGDLLDAVRKAVAGGTPFSQEVLGRLVGRAVSVRAVADPGDLTPREREVLALVAAGLSNQEIAARLHVGVTTVKTHVAALLAKTDCSNRVRLAVFAVRAGLASG